MLQLVRDLEGTKKPLIFTDQDADWEESGSDLPKVSANEWQSHKTHVH